MTTIVNKKYQKGTHYCGRGSLFGNPYIIGRDGDRNVVCDRYEEWFNFLIKDRVFRAEVLKLKDEVLECFCKDPNKYVRCHLETIVRYLDGECLQ